MALNILYEIILQCRLEKGQEKNNKFDSGQD